MTQATSQLPFWYSIIFRTCLLLHGAIWLLKSQPSNLHPSQQEGGRNKTRPPLQALSVKSRSPPVPASYQPGFGHVATFSCRGDRNVAFFPGMLVCSAKSGNFLLRTRENRYWGQLIPIYTPVNITQVSHFPCLYQHCSVRLF